MRLPLASSKLGRSIIGLNLLGLAVLIVGALVLNEFRRGLVEARVDSLTTQGAFISNVIIGAAASGDPAPTLDAGLAGDTLQLLFIPKSQRARLFDRRGALIADTAVLSDQIEERPLPAARKPGQPPPVRDGPGQRILTAADRALESEVATALTGTPVARVRRSRNGRRVVSVSLPIQRVQAVLGVLTLEADDVDQIVAKQRAALVPFILIAVFVILTSSLLLNTLVARPVTRLARAADGVRLSRARALSLPDIASRSDEIGDLARSLDAMTTVLTTRMDAIERFAADVSHEIKNPLTSIRSAVETLEMNPAEPGRSKMLGILKNDVGRLDRLITDISSASRLDAELSREAPRAVDLARLLRDIVGTYDLAPGTEAAAVVLSGAEAGPLPVMGREGAIAQVFRNLIDNARSFSPPHGSVTVRIERSGASPATVVTRIEDEGPGIPADNLDTVFERFYTNRPRGAPGGGVFGGHSGLGLSIARQIAEAHGGTVTAENRAGPDGVIAGARFIVSLPEART